MEEKIGSYKILKKIGAGGMAKVYLAVHEDVPNLQVVLKVLSDPRLVERFRQEADKLALLDSHPNICRIKHFFNHGDEIVIAMDYIDGATLDEQSKSAEPMSAEETLTIMHEVLDILEFAHRKGISHRDIKPSNIMVDTGGKVKVIDFGIAKGKTDPQLTMAGTSCGTPAYMAPEQFNPSDDTNYELVDIYAVGTTMFTMLTGELPFKGDNEFAIRDAKLFNDPPKPREINPDISKEVEQIILKAINRDPDQRYATAKQMQDAIDTLRKVNHATITVPETKRTPLPTTKSRKPLIIGASAIVVVIIAIIMVWQLSGDGITLEPPDLYSPSQDAVLSDQLPALTWEANAPDGGSYHLEYASDAEFMGLEVISDLNDNTYTPESALDSGMYYWRVETFDADGNTGGYSSVSRFTITPPQQLPARGFVSISSTLPGDFYIGDNLIASQSESVILPLDTGNVEITARNRNSEEKIIRKVVTVVTDDTTRLTFAFTEKQVQTEPDPTPPPVQKPDSGIIRVATPSYLGATIFIDGIPQNQKTPGRFKLKAGTHIVRVELPLDGVSKSKTDTVDVVTGQDEIIKFYLDD